MFTIESLVKSVPSNESRWDKAIVEGQKMPLPQAVALALQELKNSATRVANQ
jgi:hypothetical protein